MTIPKKTLAVRLFEYGGPDKLLVGEYDLPAPGPHDVVVKNMGGSVGRWDVKYRSGLLAKYQIPGRDSFPLPQQLGREASGEVVAVGPEVKRFKVGDRVIAVTHPQDPNSVETARGLGNLSRVPVPGHQTMGSYAQYLVRDETLWLHLPDSVDFEQAGVSLWAFSTSHRIVRNRLDVRPGDDVLVMGASGGMGQATVQIAKLAGGRVITTTREESKRGMLLELGADAVIVTTDKDQSRKELRGLTGGEGVDHAVDFTGSPDSLHFAKDSMRLGATSCSPVNRDTTPCRLRLRTSCVLS